MLVLLHALQAWLLKCRALPIGRLLPVVSRGTALRSPLPLSCLSTLGDPWHVPGLLHLLLCVLRLLLCVLPLLLPLLLCLLLCLLPLLPLLLPLLRLSCLLLLRSSIACGQRLLHCPSPTPTP